MPEVLQIGESRKAGEERGTRNAQTMASLESSDSSKIGSGQSEMLGPQHTLPGVLGVGDRSSSEDEQRRGDCIAELDDHQVSAHAILRYLALTILYTDMNAKSK